MALKINRRGLAVLAVGVTAGLFAGAALAQQQFFRIGTGGTGGT